jgi:hypothetical protein
LPRTLKGAAGPNPDPKGSDFEPDSEVELLPISTVPEVKCFSVLSIPCLKTSKYRDPLHTLLDYIAEVSATDLFSTHSILISNAQSGPGCDMVLVHDDDLVQLDGFSEDTVSTSNYKFMQ